MIELNGVRIWAIPYHRRRPLAPRKLPCGSVVGEATAGQRALAPWVIPARFELPDDPGRFVGLCGLFRLGSGELAAVYGAVLERLG